MSGFVFHSLAEAIRRGFVVYDRHERGYIVRRKNVGGLWESAIVEVRE